MIKSVYLCGPIEHDGEPRGWRERLSEELLKIQPKITVYNPLVKPHDMPPEAKIPQSQYWVALKRAAGTVTKDLETSFRGMHACIEMCRSMVSWSELIICRLPKVFTVGTIEELVLAKQWGKRVVFLCPEGIPSFWLLVEFAEPSTIDDVFFLTEEKLLAKIRSLNGEST